MAETAQREKVRVDAHNRADRDAVDYVTLDGEKLDYVIVADEIAGYVDVYQRAADGQVKLKFGLDGTANDILRERRFGDVVVHFKTGYGD